MPGAPFVLLPHGEAREAMRITKLLPLAVVALALAPATASAQWAGTLTKVGKDKIAYRWSRGPYSIDLEDRDAKWKLDEAEKVRDACEKMPDILLRKAWSSVKRIYRDVRPRSEGGVKPERVKATTVARKG